MSRIRLWASSRFDARDPIRARIAPTDGSGGTTTINFDGSRMSSLVTFTRAATSGLGHSGATWIDSTGMFAISDTANVARYNYSLTSIGTNKGLLIEEQRANLALRSAWTGNTNISTPPTGWTFPFGTGTSASTSSAYGNADGASAIVQTASSQRPFLNQAFTLTNGTTYTFSVYLEAIGSGTPQIADILDISLGTATVSSTTYGIDGTTGTANTTATAGRLWVKVVCSGSGTANMRVGLGCRGGITAGVTISRPQAEAGDGMTSYIPTTSAAITRPADYATIDTSALLSVLGNPAGTMVMRYYRGSSGTGSRTPLCVYHTGTVFSTSIVSVGVHASGSASHSLIVDVDTQTSTDGVAGLNKVAWGYSNATNRHSMSVNGGVVVNSTDTSFRPDLATILGIGRATGSKAGGSDWLNAEVLSLVIMQERLNDVALRAA